MAVLPESKGFAGPDLGPPPPPNTYIATCVAVLDEFGVDPKTIGWLQDAEKGIKAVDVTRFVFGIAGPNGKTYYVGTRLMKISGNEKATLYKFLRSWTGRPPEYGKDYAANIQQDPQAGCVGRSAMVSVVHTIKNEKIYPDVQTVMPVPAGIAVPSVHPLPPPTPQQPPAPPAQPLPPAGQPPQNWQQPPAPPQQPPPAPPQQNWQQPPAQPAPLPTPRPAPGFTPPAPPAANGWPTQPSPTGAPQQWPAGGPASGAPPF